MARSKTNFDDDTPLYRNLGAARSMSDRQLLDWDQHRYLGWGGFID
jgi:hypothetical protein